jgi:hypothetical protein
MRGEGTAMDAVCCECSLGLGGDSFMMATSTAATILFLLEVGVEDDR